MTLAVLFGGQGTQHPLMLPWLAEDALVAQTCEALGTRDWRAALSDPAWATTNRHAQVLLTGLGLAAWRQVEAGLPPVGALAGYSVGELAAFAAAGVFSDAMALHLAQQRAGCMDQALAQAGEGGGLLSVAGPRSRVLDLLAQACERDPGLGLAIDLGADAAILGGPRAALARAAVALEGLGLRCKPLNVAIASHVPMLAEAAAGFARALDAHDLRPPRCPLFANLSGARVRRAEDARRALAGQIASTVRWVEDLDAVHAQRVRCVLEVGPGSVLASMWRQRFPEVPARSVDEFRSAAAVGDWVHRQLR